MAASDKGLYILHVGSADMTDWAKNIPDNESCDLYVEARVDQMMVQGTKAAKPGTTVSWNEELLLAGNMTSTISLSIVQTLTGSIIPQRSCLSCIDVELGTLLARCADDKFTALEMTSLAAREKQLEAKRGSKRRRRSERKTMLPIVGVMMVKLNEQTDLGDLALKMDGLEHLLGDLSARKAVGLLDDRYPDEPMYLSNLGNYQATRFNHLGELSDLDNAILNQRKAVELMDDGHPDKPRYLLNLGDSQKARFNCLDDISDLEDAISNQERAVELMEDQHMHKPMYLSSLGDSQVIRFMHLEHLPDIQNAIRNQERAVELTDDGHPDKPMYLLNLGDSQKACFDRLGNISDLENAILNQQKAVELTDEGHSNWHIYLSALGDSQKICFDHLGNLPDLEDAILNQQKAVELTDDGHPDKPGHLTNLGISQETRFNHLGNLSDLQNAILNQEKAVELAHDLHPDKAMFLSHLGISQNARFIRLGDISDLKCAISNQEKAVELTDDGHPDKPMYLSNLGNSQEICFKHLKNISDLENAISNQVKAVDLMDEENLDWPTCLMNLGISQETRFNHLGHLSDIQNAISNQQRAVDCTDDQHPNKAKYLSNLGGSQATHFDCFGDLADLQSAILNQQKAVELTNDGHLDQPSYLLNLGISQEVRFKCLGNLSDLDNAILNQEKAVGLIEAEHPEKPAYLSHLGNSQNTCFIHLGNLADLESAISNQENALALVNDENLDLPNYLTNLGISKGLLFDRLGNISDLNNSILCHEKAIELTDERDLGKPACLMNLGISQETRFKHLGHLSDLHNSISNQKKAVERTDDLHPSKPMYLSNLGGSQATLFDTLKDFTNLQNAILNQQKAVDLTGEGHSNKAMHLSNLGDSQKTCFDHLGNLSDLENAISNQEKAVSLTSDSYPYKAHYLISLGIAQYTQYKHLNQLTDFMASISSFKAAAQLKVAYPSHALSAARQWAEISHLKGDLISALDGYRTALNLLPKVAWLGLDASSRQDWLIQEKSENLGCQAATCAIQLGYFEEAVELLDLSRSVFWQQASSLRSDLEMLKEKDPKLAIEVEQTGQQLNAGNFSSSVLRIGVHNIGKDKHQIEDKGQKRCHLVGVWEKLLERVRKLPELEHFLRPIPFHQLQQAIITGQVVIINISQYRVDALVFGPSGPIEHVTLPSIDLEEVTELSSDILLQQPVVGTKETQQSYTARYLKPALRTVWMDILIPIFNKINVPLAPCTATPQHHIWWYPTGPLTFVPIHAAGPGEKGTDISHWIVSSYVTSLDLLLQAQKRARQGLAKDPNFLVISQPNTSGLCPLPQSRIETEKLVDLVLSAGCSKENIFHLNGQDATLNCVSDRLDICSWVHFSCHGFQDPIMGMKSAFALHDGHLELGEIASKRLSNGQFAFLSACHAAAGLKELPGEAMHLAAGMQFVGFPSVIATMWSICDEDAPVVAHHTYQYLFREGLKVLDPSEAAVALNHAVLLLREDPNITLDRWAPFIHFGI